MHHSFTNAVIDALADRIRELDILPSGNDIKILYDGTTSDSPARQFVVDIYCFTGGEKCTETKFDNVSTEFMRDCMRSMMGKRNLPDGEVPWTQSMEPYHVVMNNV
jgi:hypothetical protein